MVMAESKKRQAGAEKGEVSGTENSGNAAVSGDISCKNSRPSTKCRRAYGAQLPWPGVRGGICGFDAAPQGLVALHAWHLWSTSPLPADICRAAPCSRCHLATCPSSPTPLRL